MEDRQIKISIKAQNKALVNAITKARLAFFRLAITLENNETLPERLTPYWLLVVAVVIIFSLIF